MAVLRYKELAKLSSAEVDKRLIEIKKELMKFKAQVARGTPPENPGKIRSLKRAIAKILTFRNIKVKTDGGKK